MMIDFTYNIGLSAELGTIDVISAPFPIEADVQANGWSFHIIVGEQQNGYYICIPNWSIGSELGPLDDYLWNSERLMNYTSLGEINSKIIAIAVANLNQIL